MSTTPDDPQTGAGDDAPLIDWDAVEASGPNGAPPSGRGPTSSRAPSPAPEPAAAARTSTPASSATPDRPATSTTSTAPAVAAPPGPAPSTDRERDGSDQFGVRPDAEGRRIPRRLTNVPALDGLRGVAIIMIVLAHTEESFLPSWSISTHGFGIFEGGILGPDLFFVLSGFLISSLLLGRSARHRPGERVFGPFYARRALRLLPVLYISLAVGFAYNVLVHVPRAQITTTLVGALLYITNWFSAAGRLGAPNSSQLWTLSIEEQFYLVWPAVLLLLLGIRRKASTVVVIMLVAIVAVVLYRAYLWESGASVLRLYFSTYTRADDLLIGALLAQLWTRRLTPTRGLVPAAWLAAAFFVACAIFARGSRYLFERPSTGFLYLGGFTLVGLSVAVVILGVVESPWPGTRALSWGPLQGMGRASYSLYLWHSIIFIAVVRWCASWPVVPEIALAWGVTAVIGYLSWRFIEGPFLRRKDRFEPRSLPSTEPAPTRR